MLPLREVIFACCKCLFLPHSLYNFLQIKNKKFCHYISLLLTLSFRKAIFTSFSNFLKSDYRYFSLTLSLANFKFETDVHMNLKTAHFVVVFLPLFVYNYKMCNFLQRTANENPACWLAL